MGSIYYVRNFTKGFYYHIYNRGAFKNDMFYEKSDYQTFLEVLAYYLRFPTGKPLSKLNIDNLDIKKVTNFPSMTSSFELTAFCLMPNHFHLLIKQESNYTQDNSISNFMRRLMITYSLYTKDKYMRSGALFEGRYKNVLVNSDSQLLHLTRYIHLNPLILKKYASYELSTVYPYSSYKYYLGKKKSPSWLTTREVLKLFSFNSERYKSFVEEKPFDYRLNSKVMID